MPSLKAESWQENRWGPASAGSLARGEKHQPERSFGFSKNYFLHDRARGMKQESPDPGSFWRKWGHVAPRCLSVTERCHVGRSAEQAFSKRTRNRIVLPQKQKLHTRLCKVQPQRESESGKDNACVLRGGCFTPALSPGCLSLRSLEQVWSPGRVPEHLRTFYGMNRHHVGGELILLRPQPWHSRVAQGQEALPAGLGQGRQPPFSQSLE